MRRRRRRKSRKSLKAVTTQWPNLRMKIHTHWRNQNCTRNPIKNRNTKQNIQLGSDQNPLSVPLCLSYPSTLISHKDPSSISEIEGEDDVWRGKP
jgi:hypothetical protein